MLNEHFGIEIAMNWKFTPFVDTPVPKWVCACVCVCWDLPFKNGLYSIKQGDMCSQHDDISLWLKMWNGNLDKKSYGNL